MTKDDAPDTQPPGPPDPHEKMAVTMDRFDQRMDVIEDRLELVGKENSEVLKVLHSIAASQVRSEVNENQRHATLDIVLRRIETSQDSIMTTLTDVSNEQVRQRQEMELLKVRIGSIEDRVEALEEDE